MKKTIVGMLIFAAFVTWQYSDKIFGSRVAKAASTVAVEICNGNSVCKSVTQFDRDASRAVSLDDANIPTLDEVFGGDAPHACRLDGKGCK